MHFFLSPCDYGSFNEASLRIPDRITLFQNVWYSFLYSPSLFFSITIFIIDLWKEKIHLNISSICFWFLNLLFYVGNGLNFNATPIKSRLCAKNESYKCYSASFSLIYNVFNRKVRPNWDSQVQDLPLHMWTSTLPMEQSSYHNLGTKSGMMKLFVLYL